MANPNRKASDTDVVERVIEAVSPEILLARRLADAAESRTPVEDAAIAIARSAVEVAVVTTGGSMLLDLLGD